MTAIDWVVLIGSLAGMIGYGMWKSRHARDLDGYILSNRDQRWWTIAFAIMATQASAITFLSTPGQAYTDGMRFVQYYFGLPIAMIILSITAVPIYHRLKVYTAYQYLEQRFDAKTRALAAFIFLIQRGLACGLTIYAPALIVSVLMGWNLYITNLVLGGIVIVYVAMGGTKAVNETNFQQMCVILLGMFTALGITIALLPDGVGLREAAHVAGRLGKFNAIDFSFDLTNRYNIWSGLIGGCFLALSYFGTDQSQVGRYLGGSSIGQSRIGLLVNGMVKVPMQFFILLIGLMVFAFYQFTTPPLFFNSNEMRSVKTSAYAEEFSRIEREYATASAERQERAKEFATAIRSGDDTAAARAEAGLEETSKRAEDIRQRGIAVIQKNNPDASKSDTNYVFLTFVLTYLPPGVIGLILAAVFAASMSSTAAELNALSSTTVVDFYRRFFKREATDRHYVKVSKLAVVFWGMFAIAFAESANRLGSLVEAVNILGSLFYGTVLGIFLVAFYFKRVGGTQTFIGALVGEATVIGFWLWSDISWLWYNVIGCVVTIVVAMIIPARPVNAAAAEA